MYAADTVGYLPGSLVPVVRLQFDIQVVKPEPSRADRNLLHKPCDTPLSVHLGVGTDLSLHSIRTK